MLYYIPIYYTYIIYTYIVYRLVTNTNTGKEKFSAALAAIIYTCVREKGVLRMAEIARATSAENVIQWMPVVMRSVSDVVTS